MVATCGASQSLHRKLDAVHTMEAFKYQNCNEHFLGSYLGNSYGFGRIALFLGLDALGQNPMRLIGSHSFK